MDVMQIKQNKKAIKKQVYITHAIMIYKKIMYNN